MLWFPVFLLLVYSLQLAEGKCDKNCLSQSDYKAFIILVDGSSSMGNGSYVDQNNKTVLWPEAYTKNDLWRYVEGFVNSFIEIIPREMVVVMKQYSSGDYISRGYCRYCPENLTRVLQPEWTDFQFKQASKFVFEPWTNGDTNTFQAVYRCAQIWGEKKKEKQYTKDDKALLLLVTDGQPGDNDVKKFSQIAKNETKETGLDVFLVFPSQSSKDDRTIAGMKTLRETLLHDQNDIFTWDQKKNKMDRNLVDQLLSTLCGSRAVNNQLMAAGGHAHAHNHGD